MMSKKLQRYCTIKCLIRDLLSNVSVSPKFRLAKVFNLSRGLGNETSTKLCYIELSRVRVIEAKISKKITWSGNQIRFELAGGSSY